MNKDSLSPEIIDLINDDNVLNIYHFGSYVYGTYNEKSDIDLIIVVKEYANYDNVDWHVYSANQFQQSLDNHDVQAVECFFLDKIFILKENIRFSFSLDKIKLRTAFSTIYNGSWTKGKKKLITSDYEPYLAIKSIFHSFRILDFGIQIATDGKISNYSSMNFIYYDLIKLFDNYQRNELWQKIEDKYKGSFNQKATIFKQLAPKDLSEIDKKSKLKSIFDKYNLDKTSPYFDEILLLILDK